MGHPKPGLNQKLIILGPVFIGPTPQIGPLTQALLGYASSLLQNPSNA